MANFGHLLHPLVPGLSELDIWVKLDATGPSCRAERSWGAKSPRFPLACSHSTCHQARLLESPRLEKHGVGAFQTF